MGEIAAASKEQSRGTEQVNKAVAEMDKVAQQNAANAEENASASEEVNAQAEQMKTHVNERVAMIGTVGRKADKYGGHGKKTSATNPPKWNAITCRRGSYALPVEIEASA